MVERINSIYFRIDDCRMPPAPSSLRIYDRVKHENILKRLVLDALVEGRRDDASAIFDVLERSRVPMRDPGFVFKVGLELNFMDNSFDQDVLLFLQRSATTLKIDVLEI